MLKYRIISGATTLLFGYGFIQLVFFAAPPVNKENTYEISGKLENVQVLQRRKGGDVLEVWLDREKIPLRSHLAFPGKYRNDYATYLVKNTQITVRVENRYFNNPLIDRSQNQSFYPIVSMAARNESILTDEPLLTLEDYNDFQAGNITIGKWVTAILSLSSIYILWVSFFRPDWIKSPSRAN